MKRIAFYITCNLLIINALVAQWQQANQGLYGGVISGIVVDTATNYLFAFTQSNGIFLSKDNGNSWKTANNGLTTKYVTSIAIKGTQIFAGTNEGVFISTDNGSTWISKITNLWNTYITCIAIKGSSIFVGTNGGGVFMSTDNGDNWQLANNGMYTVITSLAVIDDNIFAGALSWSMGGYVYISTNNGNSWAQLNNGIPAAQFGYNLINYHDDLIASDGYRTFLTTDNGNSWTEMETSIYKVAKEGSKICIITRDGLLISTDNGFNYTLIDYDLTNIPVYSIVFNNSAIFLGTRNGVLYSNDDGISWTERNYGLSNNIVNAVGIIGTNYFAGTESNGVYLSNDNINSWSFANNGISLHPNTGIGTVYCMVIGGREIFIGTSSGYHVYKSNFNGGNWQPMAYVSNTVTSMALNDINIYALGWGGHLYKWDESNHFWSQVNIDLLQNQYINSIAANGDHIIVSTNIGILESNDDCNSWTNINTGIFYANTLAINDQRIFTATPEGFYSSNDFGSNWLQMDIDLNGYLIKAIAIIGTNIFAGTYGGGIFLSKDNGNNWTTVNDGLANKYVNSLALSENKIVAGTNGGVWKREVSELFYYMTCSHDSINIVSNNPSELIINSNTSWSVTCNQDWLAFNSASGSENDTVMITAQINPTSSPRIAIITLSGANVETRTIAVTQRGAPSGINILQNNGIKIYPNPVNDIGKFTYTAGITVRIEFYDLAGFLVRTIDDQNLDGETQVDFSELNAGVYMYRLVDEDGNVYRGKVVRE